MYGSTDIVRMLLEGSRLTAATFNRRNFDGHTPLGMAVRHGYTEIIRMLLTDSRLTAATINGRNSNGDTPLFMAFVSPLNCQAEIVGMLLGAGADPNVFEYNGYTPLVFAVSRSQVEIVGLLLGAGADPNTPDRSGRRPLAWAKFPEIIDMLKARGGI